MERRRKAISAVLGTAIALVIVFTVFVPLIMYLQSLQTIFMQEANRRLQYELERIHEKLEVHISITPAGGAYPNHYLWVIIYNPGILTVDIPTIYIESKYKGIIEVPVDISIPPGGRLAYLLSERFYIGLGEDDVARVKVVTLRGNNYISKEVLGPRNLPYYLIVTVSNMSFGHRYAVEVAKLSEPKYGCVLLPGRWDPGCGEARRAILEPQSFNDTEGLVIFQAAPGSYTIRLYDITSNPDSGEPITHEIKLEVYDDVVLNLPIPEIEWPEIAPLRVGVIHKNLTLVAGENEKPEVVIPYLISLGTIAEPLKDILLVISSSGGSCDVEQPDSGGWKIPKLYPRETYLANFTMKCHSMGKVEYSLEIIEAYGVLSGKRYEKFERTSDQGMIKICAMERKTVVVRVEGGNPVTEEIQYVRCP